MERQQRNNLAAFNLLAKKEDAVEELRGYLSSNNNRSNILHIDDFKYVNIFKRLSYKQRQMFKNRIALFLVKK